ncbi:MAG: FAD-linked oxidase, partial [Microcoleus sp. SIO2G3]|nr:FAD-linked oxidase [Microcoleus sp. SIO2G3]
PEELTVWTLFAKAPPVPFLPENVHGKEVVLLLVCYIGDIAEGEKQIEPLRRFGDAYGEQIGVQPYVEWQQAFNSMLSRGARNYWKSHNLTELRDEVLDAIVGFAGQLPSPQCGISIASIGGAFNHVPADAMAYYHREAKFLLNGDGRWDDAADDERCIKWAREFFQTAAPYASGGSYVNFMTEDEGDRVAAIYGANYDRLVQIKKQYDPDNIFHLNQNIKP